MKALIVNIILAIVVLFSIVPQAQAEAAKQDPLYDMGMIMRFMNHGLSVALKGADFVMLGELGQSEKLDRDAIVHGTIMIKDGKAMIREMLEGRAMTALYTEGNFDKKFMDELHALGEKMLEVIERVERLHGMTITQQRDVEK